MLKNQERLVVAYISGQFNNLPVSRQMAPSLYMHNRAIFDVTCYSTKPSDGSDMRSTIEANSPRFIDLTPSRRAVAKSQAAIQARAVRSRGTHVLINLDGAHDAFQDALHIAATRPAQVQISHLGFGGTTGHPAMDYVVTEASISPPDLHVFSEKTLFLPHTLMPTSQQIFHREVLTSTVHRQVLAKMVNTAVPLLSSFNQLYKLDPYTFHSWTNVIQRLLHFGTYLWLVNRDIPAVSNIALEGLSRGLGKQHLGFTGRFEEKVHLLYKGLSDVHLDTPVYNAHSTAADILWAGVPSVTMVAQNSQMVGREGLGMMHAIGLKEGVTLSMKEYEDLVFFLIGL